MKTIGSLHPLKQPMMYFRIKNKATRTFVTVCGDSANPRWSKLSVCSYNGKTTQVWFYCNGLIKSKANYACIDIIGGQGKPGTKVNLWTEHGRNHQKWRINSNGTITSFLDLNLRLDVKGGDFNDKDNVILNMAEEEQQTQFWDIEMLR
ncbi:beta/gamma crystallin domain-containing protein 3-like [Pristis pectinata]|uniref:beta/gamma crystallin domain-containing protein 3-like n=1 Tax=Pristis pectinata TaxID=685728 RepID=UPI00223D4044|nr:beta/gamma crystallin domain-containing protein 3-like [Pristis pectinata]